MHTAPSADKQFSTPGRKEKSLTILFVNDKSILIEDA